MTEPNGIPSRLRAYEHFALYTKNVIGSSLRLLIDDQRINHTQLEPTFYKTGLPPLGASGQKSPRRAGMEAGYNSSARDRSGIFAEQKFERIARSPARGVGDAPNSSGMAECSSRISFAGLEGVFRRFLPDRERCSGLFPSEFHRTIGSSNKLIERNRVSMLPWFTQFIKEGYHANRRLSSYWSLGKGFPKEF
jgi:hypothetical protein